MLVFQVEFESREVALRDALESDFQADLDGQLLLAEIRHQKEIEQLRVELVRQEEPSGETIAAGPMVVYSPETPQREREDQDTPGSSSSARRPSLSRRPLPQKPVVGVKTTSSGNLGRKFRAFKPPVQASAPGAAKKTERQVSRVENRPSKLHW